MVMPINARRSLSKFMPSGRNNGSITDAINLLSFLFSGGAEPICQDAADVNDSGVIDVADAVFVLNYLFVGGAVPPYPFPSFGLDPTTDSLDDC